MSRIGRLPVGIPAGVEVKVEAGNKVTVKGPLGTLVKELPVEMDIKVSWEKLGEIIGESYSEELIDQLFSQFCLGK